ncbi:MAG: hypothetical protein ACTSRW_11775 [Candidatus Helarchaeota archaeon]
MRKIRQELPEALKKIGKEEYEFEMRLHPLIRWHWASLSRARGDYKPYKIDENIIEDLLTPRVHYFTDPENNTPKDPNYGRLSRNEAALFPNLFSWNKIAVCKITEKESIPINEFTSEQFFDAFILSQEFFEKEATLEIDFYPTINMNYLRPAGSSVCHPHLQVLTIPEAPPPLLSQVFFFGDIYKKNNDSNFFTDYIFLEKKNEERWIGMTGEGEHEVAWMTSFSPLAGRDEVMFIVESEAAFPLSERIWRGIADGFIKILNGYHEMGVRSFNMAMFSDRWKSIEHTDKFRIFGLIWSRPLRNLDSSDMGFAEIAYKIANIQNPPEKVAEVLRKTWEK